MLLHNDAVQSPYDFEGFEIMSFSKSRRMGANVGMKSKALKSCCICALKIAS